MVERKSPSFQFYPRDFVADFDVAAMTLEEAGAYAILLSYAWLKDGLPNDLAKLARALHVSSRKFNAMWNEVGQKFYVAEDGRLRNARQEHERAAQAAFVGVAGKGGKASAEARRRKFGSANPRAVREPAFVAGSQVCEPAREPTVNKVVHDAHEPNVNTASASALSTTLQRIDVPSTERYRGGGKPPTPDGAGVWETFRVKALTLRNASLPLVCRKVDEEAIFDFLSRYPDPAKRAWLIDAYLGSNHRPILQAPLSVGQLCKWAAWLEAQATAPVPDNPRTAERKAALATYLGTLDLDKDSQ